MKLNRHHILFSFLSIVLIVLIIDVQTDFIGLRNLGDLKSSKIYHFFKPKKEEAQKPEYRFTLNDRLTDYWKTSFINGIGIIKTRRDVWKKINKGQLVLLENNEHYVLDTMYYSYPYLTPKAKKLIDTIGYLFHKRIEKSELTCTRLNVTSLLRSTGSVKRLTKKNKNAVKNSAHLHGTAFDISYKTYYLDHKTFNPQEIQQLGDTLGKIIFELREQKKCFATYETWQTCFHVVAR